MQMDCLQLNKYVDEDSVSYLVLSICSLAGEYLLLHCPEAIPEPKKSVRR